MNIIEERRHGNDNREPFAHTTSYVAQANWKIWRKDRVEISREFALARRVSNWTVVNPIGDVGSTRPGGNAAASKHRSKPVGIKEKF